MKRSILILTLFCIIFCANAQTCDTTLLTISPPKTICQRDSVTLTVGGGSGNYSWSPSATLSSPSGSSVKAAPNVTTTYTALDQNLNACASVTITVNPATLYVSSPQTICRGTSTTLYADGTATVLWTPSTGLSDSTLNNVTATPLTSTTYTITGKTGDGCSASATITIKVDTCNSTTHGLSEARWYLAGTSVGNKVLFAGGTKIGAGEGTSAENYSKAVDIFNNATQVWSSATLSQARTELAATSLGMNAFFGGGLYRDTSSAVVDIYDNSNNGWSTAHLSQARHDLAAASAGTKSFFAGGIVFGGSTSNVVDIYDSVSHTWTSDTLSIGRTNLAGASVGSKVLFAGGWNYVNGQQFSNVVDIYNTSTNAWTRATLSQPRIYMAAATVGTKVFFAGGRGSNGIASNVVDIYDDQTGTWSTATLSLARDLLAATAEGTKIFFGGGGNSNGITNVVDVYDDSTSSWSTTELSIARNSLAAASVGTKVFFAGGLEPPASSVADIFDTPNPAQKNCPSHFLTGSPSITICPGAPTTLSVGGGRTYTWAPAPGLSATMGSSVTASPETTTIYTIVGTDSTGCLDSLSTTVTIANLPTPTITTANINSVPTLVSSVLAGNQWYKDGVKIPGDTTSTLSVTSSGAYTVQVTTELGCISPMSAEVNSVITGLEGMFGNSAMRIYPNPADHFLTINCQCFDQGNGINVKIIDLLGRSAMTKTIFPDQPQLDVSGLSPGYYVVLVSQNNTTQIQKFIKK